jgi:hypothetical protein
VGDRPHRRSGRRETLLLIPPFQGPSLRNKVVCKTAAEYWLCHRNTNFQAPNPKQYPNSNLK